MWAFPCVPIRHWIWTIHWSQAVGNHILKEIEVVCTNRKIDLSLTAIQVPSQVPNWRGEYCWSVVTFPAFQRASRIVISTQSYGWTHQVCNSNCHFSSDDNTWNYRSLIRGQRIFLIASVYKRQKLGRWSAEAFHTSMHWIMCYGQNYSSR